MNFTRYFHMKYFWLFFPHIFNYIILGDLHYTFYENILIIEWNCLPKSIFFFEWILKKKIQWECLFKIKSDIVNYYFDNPFLNIERIFTLSVFMSGLNFNSIVNICRFVFFKWLFKIIFRFFSRILNFNRICMNFIK